jgi:hypothetical protein
VVQDPGHPCCTRPQPKLKKGRKGRKEGKKEATHANSCLFVFFFLLISFFVLCQIPVNFLLTITIPVVDFEEEDQKWNKYLQMMQCVISPIWLVFGA